MNTFVSVDVRVPSLIVVGMALRGGEHLVILHVPDLLGCWSSRDERIGSR